MQIRKIKMRIQVISDKMLTIVPKPADRTPDCMMAAEVAVAEKPPKEKWGGTCVRGSNGRNHARLWCLLLIVALLGLTGQAQAARREGWFSKNGRTYYYEDGSRLKGWQEIDGKTYRFTANGVLMTNRITRTKSGQYVYLDQSGAQSEDSVIQLAVNFVVKHTQTSWSSRRKLNACYNYLVWNMTYRHVSLPYKISNFPVMARSLFSLMTGDCHSSAIALTYIARVLGYDCRVVYGKVSSRGKVARSVHGWSEICVDGEYLMYDVTMQRAHRDATLHAIPREDYPYALKAIAVYDLTAEKGKVKWKKADKV